MRLALPLVLLFAAAGCHGTFISASLYDQSCTQASDCTAVSEGDACALCGGCPNAAVNSKAAAQFDADKRAIACVRLGQPPVACAAAACLQPTVVCVANKCQLGQPR
jgi:hypothetical protein